MFPERVATPGVTSSHVLLRPPGQRPTAAVRVDAGLSHPLPFSLAFVQLAGQREQNRMASPPPRLTPSGGAAGDDFPAAISASA